VCTLVSSFLFCSKGKLREEELTRRNILSWGERACVLPVGLMVCWVLRISGCCRLLRGSSRAHWHH
jgi:hypothetical protein